MPSTDVNSYKFREREHCIEKMDQVLEELPEYVSRFLYNKLNGPRRMQPRTALAYAGDLKLFMYYLTQNSPACRNLSTKEISTELLGKLDVDDIEEYYQWLTQYTKNGEVYSNSPSSQKRKIASVSSLYKFLMKKHYVKANPCDLLDCEKINYKPIVAMSDRQQAAFLSCVGLPKLGKDGENNKQSEKWKERYTAYRDTAIAYLFLGTGLRVSELVGINLEDLNYKDKYVIVTRKGGKTQQIFFSDEVRDALNDYLDNNREKLLPPTDSPDYDALFLSMKHKRISVRNVEQIIKDIARTALPPHEAEKISCHKLRSTYGTRLLKGSNDIALVAEVLGHSDINTTKKHYSKVQNLEDAPKYVSVLPRLKKGFEENE